MTIETERLILRPFLEMDAADVFEYLHKPAVNCFASMKLDTLEDAKAEMKNRVGETEYCFAVTLKDGGKVIGEIDAFPENDPHDSGGAAPDTFSPCWMPSCRLPPKHRKAHGLRVLQLLLLSVWLSASSSQRLCCS